jgi:hypothetical protein
MDLRPLVDKYCLYGALDCHQRLASIRALPLYCSPVEACAIDRTSRTPPTRHGYWTSSVRSIPRWVTVGTSVI